MYVGRSRRQGRRASGTTIERSLDKAIQRGKLDESAKDDVLGRLTGTTSLDDLARRRHRRRGHRRGPAIKTALFENLDEICKPGRDPGHHDLEPADHLAGQGDLAAAGRRRHALLQPRADHEAGRGRLDRATDDDVAETTRALCDAGRQGRGLLRRPGRLHRQRAAVPLPQRRGQDARGALRHGRRHRHRDEVRLRAADGPVRAARRGRQRRVAGDPARALPGVPRARLRAGAAAGAPGHRRLPRPEDQARFPGLLAR